MRLLPLICLTAGFVASVANAELITVNPDSFANGTDISHAFAGVTLAAVGVVAPTGVRETGIRPPLTFGSVYAVECSGCMSRGETVVDGHNLFGNDLSVEGGGTTGLTARWWESRHAETWYANASPFKQQYPWVALLISFDEPTQYVQFYGGGARDTFDLQFWTADGVRLGSCDTAYDYTNELPCTRTPLGVHGNWDDFNAPYAVTFRSEQANIAYVTAGGRGGASYVQSFSYTKVPEPMTVGMFVLGLAGIAIGRRQRKAL